MPKLMMDRNLYAMPGVKEAVDFLESKMVLHVNVHRDQVAENKVDVILTVTTLHMGAGPITNRLPICDLHPHNAQVLLENLQDGGYLS